jgi:hypothetical protein
VTITIVTDGRQKFSAKTKGIEQCKSIVIDDQDRYTTIFSLEAPSCDDL